MKDELKYVPQGLLTHKYFYLWRPSYKAYQYKEINQEVREFLLEEKNQHGAWYIDVVMKFPFKPICLRWDQTNKCWRSMGYVKMVDE